MALCRHHVVESSQNDRKKTENLFIYNSKKKSIFDQKILEVANANKLEFSDQKYSYNRKSHHRFSGIPCFWAHWKHLFFSWG